MTKLLRWSDIDLDYITVEDCIDLHERDWNALLDDGKLTGFTKEVYEMVKCRECGCNYDNGELVNGVCLECMEEERQRQIRASSVARMMNSPSRQMVLGLEGMKNAVPD